MTFIVKRPDSGKDCFLVDWDERESVWHSDSQHAHRFVTAGEAMDAALAFDRRDLPHLGQISIVEVD